MKILYNKSGFVDFEAPVYMWPDQFEKFENFMKELIDGVTDTIFTIEKGRTLGDIQRSPMKWTAEERYILLNPNLTDEELVKKFEDSGRSSTSIIMQRADFVPQFIAWARKKGYKSDKISKTIIEEFMSGEK